MFKKFLLYALRWQLSTPILAVCVIYFKPFGDTTSTIIANVIGSCIFFWIDRWLFRRTNLFGEIWEVRKDIVCHDCNTPSVKGFRLIKAGDYDRTEDKNPQYRCLVCAKKKYKTIFKGDK